MSVAVEEPNIRVVIHGILHSEFQEVFGPYLVTDEHSSEQSRKSKLITLWKDIPKEKHGISLQYYMQEVQSQNNARCMLLLLTVLEELVANNTVDAKLVCDAVLSSDHLTWQDSTLWCASLELIQRIVGGVDYKGCRDLLRTILEKAKGVPSDANVVTIQVIDAVHKVVSYILNRNSCLLPSYFAVNEVTKFSNDDKNWQHWKLGSLLADFVQTFRLTAQMVTVAGRSHLYPIVGHSSLMSNVWKLNINSLCFSLSGPLPYDKELYKPQSKLLRYVLEQPYSRDMICTMLGLNKQGKQRCAVLEEHLVDLVVMAMERSEKMGDAQSNDDLTVSHLLWQHLSSQVIFFVLFQFASFPHIVMALYKKLKDRNLKTGRDHLMWVLLQFISGSIQKNQLSDFLPVMKLYDLLYPDQQLLPLPDITKSSSTYSMAVTSIWISLSKKAQTDNKKLQRPIPRALQAHVDFLNQTLSTKNFPMTDYTIALLCNAYSTSAELFMLPMGVLVENISGNVQDIIPLPGGLTASSPVQPLQMTMLDSLTVHAKMSLIHSIVTKVIQQAQAKSNVALSPALVETYSRLLVYMEIESLGIKGFISKVLPSVFKSNGWGILHTLLEIFSYRLHHIQPNYRLQLLGHLNTLSTVPQTNQTQLQICVESTALRLIMGLGSSEVQPQLSRMMSETRNSLFIFEKSEELNRALVLTLARAMHITGTESMSNTWWRDILTKIMHYTPHSWSSNTLACFPVSLQEFFAQNPITTDMATTLSCVPEEYRRWKSMASEADLIQHFTNPNAQPLFLCVLWKSLLDDSRISPTAYRVLERLGPRALSSHLRHFAEHLVNEFSAIPGGNHVNRCVEALNDMIWKCNIISIDRLVLCLALRNFEGTSEAQVRFFIIQLILLKQADFRNRVQAFIRDNSPEHWTLDNWHEKHIAFHNKFPEKFYYDGVQDMQGTQSQYLPIYFGNVCLRFLPVFDIVIHRFLELPAVLNSLEILLDHLGGLYKFHDRPITYLYNTLHYYERRLKDQIPLKKKLVLSIIGALKDNRPHNWCLTEQYLSYLEQPLDAPLWCPDQSYYVSTIKRLVDTMSNTIPPPFPHFDCRFNEFPNPSAHALYATCIELMALPVPSEKVGSAILDIVLERACSLPRESIMQWMNAIGLVLTALPESYWSVINDRLEQLLSSTSFSRTFPLHCLQLNFVQSHSVMAEHQCSYILAVCHAIWQHASIGQLTSLPVLLRTRLKPLISTEEQLLFICHLFGPFLQRFHIERTRCLLEIATELYEILRNVDKQCAHLNHMDEITDFLYHIKYMFVGDGIKNEVEKVICKLRPALQLRLRFISYHSKEENTAPVQTSANIKTIF